MKIGILETGRAEGSLLERFGEYPPMFATLFREVDPGLDFATYSVMDGRLPERHDECTAWLITGSKTGVYDPDPWIEPLKTFLQEVRSGGTPIVGICFGHQIMAEAFGGRAEKSHKGWGVGIHDYEMRHRPSWLSDAPERFAMHAMHQDQVTELPADATTLATSPFCEHAMVCYGDPERPDAISIQPHPEFAHHYAAALIDWREEVMGREVSALARTTLGAPVARAEFVHWALRYLETAGSRARAA